MTLARRVAVILAAVVLLFGGIAGGWLAGRLGIGSIVDPASLTDLEREFAESMRGASLVGSYSMAGREDRTARPDRYDISSVEKVGDDLWRFNVSMNCCGLGGSTIPVAVPMRWIGDTPMIMMTNTSLPGLDTYTVRVFFYGDRYAGTWQHGENDGHMFGRIERRQP